MTALRLPRGSARPAPGGRPLAVGREASVPEALPRVVPAGIVTPMSSSPVRRAPSGSPPPVPGGSEAEPRPRSELTAVAEALGIPWERLLEAEIQAERTLRGFVGESGGEVPFWRLLSALPATALDSWRVRERLAERMREARLTRSGSALRSVREAADELCGRAVHAAPSPSEALALHLSLALERVRELARVARAAERAKGERAARVATILEKTGCREADADWALARAESPGRTHAIDDAVRQARAEGFEIPIEDSEFHSFVALRRLARRNPPSRRRGRRLARPRRPALRPSHRLAS